MATLKAQYVLMVGNAPSLVQLLREAIREAGRDDFGLECVASMHEGIERLRSCALGHGPIHAVLVRLSLPDNDVLAGLPALVDAAAHVPVLVFGDTLGREILMQVLACGAQDYLVLAQVGSGVLARALNGAIGRKAAEEQLFQERERAQVTLNSIGDAVLCTDIEGRVSYLNPVAERLTGWSLAAAQGQALGEVFHVIDGASRAPLVLTVLAAITSDQPATLVADCLLVGREGVETQIADSVAPIHDSCGRVTGVVVVFRDASAARLIATRMSHLARHDFLTDLPNRLLLDERLAHAVQVARRRGGPLALVFIDLDHLKPINDTLGHALGDQLLKAVAERLIACVRDTDTVSRQGGDEFVVLLTNLQRNEDAARIAEKMRVAVTGPYSIDGHLLHLTASLGISLFPQDGSDAVDLIKHADVAMYHAKALGRDNVQFFDAGMNLRTLERQSIEAGLHLALANREFLLHYQPIVRLDSGAVVGLEALVRWDHPQRGLLAPASFIGIAEDCGLIVPIGLWVLQTACRQAAAWCDAGIGFGMLSVNISAVEFAGRDFLDHVLATLQQTGFAAARLELELTETVLMQSLERTTRLLPKLRELGVTLAVDDFGTGYSSLSYLKRFPISTLKIDQSFVGELEDMDNDAAIVAAVVGIGARLHQRVIAEGIETAGQRAALRVLGCEEGQGFHFSPPLAAHDCTALLARGEPLPTGPSPAVCAPTA